MSEECKTTRCKKEATNVCSGCGVGYCDDCHELAGICCNGEGGGFL